MVIYNKAGNYQEYTTENSNLFNKDEKLIFIPLNQNEKKALQIIFIQNNQ